MKTTVEISEPLLKEARRLAAREGVTLRALVERGLRQVLHGRRDGAFKLRSASFGGNGVQPGVDEGDWRNIRELAYEGRGG